MTAVVDPAKLTAIVTEGEHCMRFLHVTVAAELVDAERQAASRNLAGRMKLKGFRKGKVPTDFVRQRFASVVREEAMDKLVRESAKAVIAARGMRPVSRVEIDNIDFAPEGALTFDASFEVAPEVKITRVGGFVLAPPPGMPPLNGAVERHLEGFRQRSATWRSTDEGTPMVGDRATVVLARVDSDSGDDRPDEVHSNDETRRDDEAQASDEARRDDEVQAYDEARPDDEEGGSRSYDFLVGSDQALPDIQKAVQALTVGEEGEFDVEFPGDEEGSPGETRRIRVHLTGRRVQELPDLEELARNAGKGSPEELRDAIRDALESAHQDEVEQDRDQQLVRMFVEANDFDVPASLVDKLAEIMVDDIVAAYSIAPEDDTDELRAEFRTHVQEAAEFNARRELLLRELASQHGLEATEEELDKEVETIAREDNETPGEVYSRLQRSGEIADIHERLTGRKVRDFLRRQSGLQ